MEVRRPLAATPTFTARPSIPHAMRSGVLAAMALVLSVGLAGCGNEDDDGGGGGGSPYVTYHYDGVQCETQTWEEGSEAAREAAMASHYEEQGVDVQAVEAAAPDPDTAYCQQCGCPTGWSYSVLARGAVDTLSDDGWRHGDGSQ